jgi:hypothetical protein
LNGYGQFLGSVYLTFTFSKDEIIPPKHISPPRAPVEKPVPVPVIEQKAPKSPPPISRTLSYEREPQPIVVPSPPRPHRHDLEIAVENKAISYDMLLSQADDEDLRKKF